MRQLTLIVATIVRGVKNIEQFNHSVYAEHDYFWHAILHGSPRIVETKVPKARVQGAPRPARKIRDGSWIEEKEEMQSQDAHIPLEDGLSYHITDDPRQPEQYLSIASGDGKLQLNKRQALALFRIMLDDLPTLVGSNLEQDRNLYEIDLLRRFHRSIDWLASWSQSDLAEPDFLNQAHEQYQQAYERQEEMLDVIDSWQVTLEHEYGKLEEAAEELGVTLDDPEEVPEFEDEDES